MKIPKLVTQAFWIISILILITGFCGVAGAQDQQTVKQLQQRLPADFNQQQCRVDGNCINRPFQGDLSVVL